MKKLLSLLSLFFAYNFTQAQCSVTTSATTTTITCGQSVSLSAFGQSSGTVVLSESFNSGGFGPGWGSTPGAVNFSNPCSPGGADGTPHAWMDNNTAVPRILMSSPYNLTSATAGVTICFDLLFAEQGNSAPCEGPDEPDEGVFLQYSTNGGSTWTDIHYFDPNGGNDPTFTTWHNWCFVIPAAAITANTTFQWLQTADSGADYDHWGIDNVQIYQNDVNGQLVWLHDGYNYGVGNPGGVNPTPVSPTTTTTYTAQLTTGTGVVCTDAITITVVDPVFEVTASATPASLCPGDCANITATAQEILSPHTTPTYENNEFEAVVSTSTSININVQGLNTTSIANGTITEVVINGFNYGGVSGCTSFGGCPCNGGTISFGQTCNLNTSGFTVTLTAPGGCDIILAPSGVATGNYSNTTFVPVGGSALGGTFPNGGTWAPNEPMSGLNGCNPNGVWTLTFSGPTFGFGFGTLSGWSISFDDPAIYGPVTYTWSPTTNMTNSTTLTPTVCPPASMTYSLTVANPSPGCATHVETVPITVAPCSGCVPPTFTVTPPAAVCSPTTINLSSTVSGTGANIVTFHATNADATGDVNPMGSSVVSTSGTYFIRVEDATDPLCFSVQSVTATVNTPAVLTPVISGSASVCPNATAVTYSVTNNPPNTYAWTVPAGATIVSGQGTNSITVDFGANGGNVNVTETASCGSGSATFAVITNTGTLTPVISGSASVCPNATSVTYSVTNNPPNTYAWTVPVGATIVSGQGTNSITVDFGANGGNVDVTETASCASGSGTFAVTTNTVTLTPSILGSISVCPNATAVTYSVTNNPPNTYAWTVPVGATIVSGQGTNSITVDFGVAGGNVDVTETSSCGSGSNSLVVTVSTTPVTSVITGPTPVCPNATAINYSVTNTSGSTYNWTVPAGATITSGQTTNSITVDFGASGGTISVTETSSCGIGAPESIVVITSTTPVTSAITGPTSVCANATGQIYSVVNTTGSTYVWTVPAGATITSGQNTNSITVNFGATAGTISVTETSTCGSGTPVTTIVSIIPVPALPSITGPASACANATGLIYSVINNPPNTYAWTVPLGATIVSGQGTNSIVVNLGATAGNVSVIETNTCGASPQATTAVTLSTTPVTSAITGNSPVCSGATAQTFSVTNTIGSTYAWTVPSGATIVSGQGTNSINIDFGTNGGTISVTETASCGSGTAVLFPVTVNLPPATPTINGNLTVCANASAVTYSVTNNVGSTYAWTASGGATIASGAASNSVSVNFATTNGTLQVSESNTCGVSIATFSVAVTNPILTLVASASSVCPGFTSTLGASGADTYTWSPAGSLNTVAGASVIATPTATTIYTVNATLAGCPVSSTITVTLLPPLTLTVTSVSTAVCTGTTTTITATGASSYTWAASPTLNTLSGATVIASPTVQTTYSVVGTTATCAGSAVITVSVTPAPTIQLTPNDVTICEGESVNILATGADTYVWANNATNFVSNNPPINSDVTVNPPSTHLYFVTGSTNGCTDFDTLTVTVLPKIIANAGINDTICVGESVGLTGFGASTHLWSPGSTLTSVNTGFTTATPLISTNYVYTASYNGLCPATDTVRVVVNSLPVVFAGQDTTIDVEDAALLNGFTNATSFFWSNTGTLNCLNCLSPIATPTTTTTYVFFGENQFGCENSDTVTVFVSQDYALYVPIAFSPNDDKINEGWKPQGFGIKKIQIFVYDRWGQKVFEAKDMDTAWDGVYKGRTVQQDVYVFKISAEAYSGNKITKVGHVTVVK